MDTTNLIIQLCIAGNWVEFGIAAMMSAVCINRLGKPPAPTNKQD